MRLVWVKAGTLVSLGWRSLWRVFCYRAGVYLGLNPVRRLKAVVPRGDFFSPQPSADKMVGADTEDRPLKYFGWLQVPCGDDPPDWLWDPISRGTSGSFRRPWWEIPDFDPGVSDIKVVWEASRFDWVLRFALEARGGAGNRLGRLNTWLADWCEENPPYCGPNWKCGQETSIRVMRLALAALWLDQVEGASPGLRDLVRLHLQRIAPTLRYAIAQDNNHGTSEAAALYIGGSWLRCCGEGRRAEGWERQGRRWLEERIGRLVAEDGSFSQHSTNYHRLFLDTMSIVEVWRRAVGGQDFSEAARARCRAATRWLHAFAEAESGEVPNLGSNDGAWLLPAEGAGYRDYRPSIQLAAALFCGSRAYADGACNVWLQHLSVPVPEKVLDIPQSGLFDRGGYARLNLGRATAFVRYPRFRFRPCHADALHVDLWVGGENLLRDGGSYSYAAEPPWQEYFPGTASHNTVQFDGRDQMPRLGRFLFGAWLKTSERSPEVLHREEAVSFSAAYTDWLGCLHRRTARLEASRMVVEDEIAGFKDKAILRWRLRPGDWLREGDGWESGGMRIGIKTDVPIVRMEIVEGWESRYYLKRDPLPVLEVETKQPGLVRSVVSW